MSFDPRFYSSASGSVADDGTHNHTGMGSLMILSTDDALPAHTVCTAGGGWCDAEVTGGDGTSHSLTIEGDGAQVAVELVEGRLTILTPLPSLNASLRSPVPRREPRAAPKGADDHCASPTRRSFVSHFFRACRNCTPEYSVVQP